MVIFHFYLFFCRQRRHLPVHWAGHLERRFLRVQLEDRGRRFQAQAQAQEQGSRRKRKRHRVRKSIFKKWNAIVAYFLFYLLYIKTRTSYETIFQLFFSFNHRCKLCGKYYTQSYLINRHMLVHSDLKEFKCPICEKEFKTSVDLKTHLRNHESEDVRYTHCCELCGKR